MISFNELIEVSDFLIDLEVIVHLSPGICPGPFAYPAWRRTSRPRRSDLTTEHLILEAYSCSKSLNAYMLHHAIVNIETKTRKQSECNRFN